jgi:hypothetical protein
MSSPAVRGPDVAKFEMGETEDSFHTLMKKMRTLSAFMDKNQPCLGEACVIH